MCVCVCVCAFAFVLGAYVCMYACMHVCMCVSCVWRVCMCVCMHEYAYACIEYITEHVFACTPRTFGLSPWLLRCVDVSVGLLQARVFLSDFSQVLVVCLNRIEYCNSIGRELVPKFPKLLTNRNAAFSPTLKGRFTKKLQSFLLLSLLFHFFPGVSVQV